MNRLPRNVQLRILGALVEGNSIRAIERMTGVHRDTIMRLGVQIGEACHAWAYNFVGPVHASTLQIDEIWTYIGKKQKRVKYEDTAETGDQYVFVGMDADTKLVISYLVGKRTQPTTLRFLRDLRSRVLGAPQLTTDGFAPYPLAVGQTFGPEADYAIVEKDYVAEGKSGRAEHRYSPGRIRGMTKKVVSGTPNLALASTSYVERQNLTMRMQMRRFTRLTNGFSKKLRNLEAAVALHFAHFNLCREHETLRKTPAMAAGLTDHVWSLAELVETVLQNDAPAPIPTPTPFQRRLPGLRLIRGGKA